jgi:hypothetical protein
VIAPWIPVTVVPTSFATVAIETFITDVSSVMRNCPDASVSSTSVAPLARTEGAIHALVTSAIYSEARPPAKGVATGRSGRTRGAGRQARAFCLSASNSAWLMAPLSSSALAFSISAAEPPPPAASRT